MIKEYHLCTEDQGADGDRTYSLVFTERGEMRVRLVRHFGSQYKTPEVQSIDAKEFDRIEVRGRPLRELVVNKLGEILP